MTKKLKRIFVGIMAAAICIIGSMSSISASATSWRASHVNTPGAPTSESRIDYITVYQDENGALAICNHNTHSNASATIGITTINCVSHDMSSATIYKTNSTSCYPNVGDPNYDIPVVYKVSAYTPTYNDIFWSKGNIVKKNL